MKNYMRNNKKNKKINKIYNKINNGNEKEESLIDVEYADSIETPKSLVAEKLIMNELLNADDFNVLLETTITEFQRTFGISNKNLKGEREIE